MNGGYSSTVVMEDGPENFPPSSRYLGTLRTHSPSKRASSAISKAYKAASTLYLTRRLPEALQTIEPLITVTKPASDDEEVAVLAPIATASRSLRIKVWNFYLTLLNAIIEVGQEEGKNDFGSTVWRGIVSKVRDGSIWEEVVQSGYGGREGSVDADVVANLATLLLGQSPTQTLNQQRLETYLSFSSNPELALADRLDDFTSAAGMQRRPSHASGANTPRDLNSRAKVLELYTLHVLPRNEEWETSREFIRASPELDEERRDAFLYTLDTLREQAQSEQDHERELLRQRDEELARQRQEAEARRLKESRLLDEQSKASEVASVASSSAAAKSAKGGGGGGYHVRSNSEVDYGIEDAKVRRSPFRKKESGGSSSSSSKALRPGPGPAGPSSSKTASRAPGKSRKAPPRTMLQRIPIILGLMRKLMANMTRTMMKEPTVLIRNILFLLAFLIVFARRDVRDRLGGITGIGWAKIKATIGMGTRVSYI